MEASGDGDADEASEDESTASFETFRLKHGTELTPKQAQRVAEIVPKNMIVFRFDADIFTAGQVLKKNSGEKSGQGVLHSTEVTWLLLSQLPRV